MANMLLQHNDTNTGEQEREPFDFNQWIIEFELLDIKQCFIEHNMNTLGTLNMDNNNFSGLMIDEKILSQSHLIPKIIKGIQSLKHLQQTQPPQSKLIFMTAKEDEVLRNIQNYIDELDKLQTEFENEINQNIQIKKQKDYKRVSVYNQLNISSLDAVQHKIDKYFTKLHQILNDKQQTLDRLVNVYKTEINDIENTYSQNLHIIEQKSKVSLEAIQQDKIYYADCIQKCKSIINQHYDNMNIYHFKSSKQNNEEREKEIAQIGDMVHSYHTEHNIELLQNKAICQEFLQMSWNDGDEHTKLYKLCINDALCKQICCNLEKLITVVKCNDNMQKYVNSVGFGDVHCAVITNHNDHYKMKMDDDPITDVMTDDESGTETDHELNEGCADDIKITDRKITSSKTHVSKLSTSVPKSKSKSESVSVRTPFPRCMTYPQFSRLKIGDKLDHEYQDGSYRLCVIKKWSIFGKSVLIHFDGLSDKYDIWSDYKRNPYKFYKAGSISGRPGHRSSLKDLDIGDYVDVNVARLFPKFGWKRGEIVKIIQGSGQRCISFRKYNSDAFITVHVDNENEVAPFRTKTSTETKKSRNSSVCSRSKQ